MPKLYKSIKVEQGLKIGLREPSGSEWFADMTIDRDRRTCRKIKLGFDPTDKENVIEAQKKAKALYRSFKKEIESEGKLEIKGWQTHTFTLSLVLLWFTGLIWIVLELLNSATAQKPYLLTLHGLLIVPLLIGLGGLWVAHIPDGWKPKKKKLSGISLIFSLSFLILSGLMLYYLRPLYLKDFTGLSHSILGLILVPLVFWHYSKRKLN
jgi:hypothetical protein